MGLWLGLMALALAPGSSNVAWAEERWVQTHVPTELWSSQGPQAISFGKLRPFSYLRLHSEQLGDRFYVYNCVCQSGTGSSAGNGISY